MANDDLIQNLIERAVNDPDFRSALIANPMEAAQAAGYPLQMDDVRAFLGMTGISNAEAVEVLKDRLSHSMAFTVRTAPCG